MLKTSSAKRSEPHPVDRHVGRRVGQKRVGLGHNQSDLGDALHLTFQQIQKYEKGSNRISASKLWMMAEFFQVDIAWFFEGLEARGDVQSVTVPDAPVTCTTVEISRLAPALSTQQQKIVLDLMREFEGSEPDSPKRPKGQLSWRRRPPSAAVHRTATLVAT